MTIWDDRYQSGEGLRWWPNEELVRFLGKHYGSTPTSSWPDNLSPWALDLGCGTGANAWLLTEVGFNTFGIDSSEAATKLAKDFLSNRFIEPGPEQFRVESLPFIRFDNGTFDLVVDCQTIQHLSWAKRTDVYKEIARILKPQGKFWSMCWAGTARAAELIYGGCYPELGCVTMDELRAAIRGGGLLPGIPYRVTRSYPEQGYADGEWLVIEAIKP